MDTPRTYRPAQSPRLFDVRLPALPLVRGGTVEPHHARGFWWGPAADAPVLDARTETLSETEAKAALAQAPYRRAKIVKDRSAKGPGLDPEIPTVLLIHALTGDARAGGPEGWWEPLIGPGKPLDPARVRILCFNNLGSCYGSSGPADEGFPGAAVLTPWDTARAILQALTALGVERVALVSGGSVGGMVATSLAALAPGKIERLLPIATALSSSAWVLGFNHVAREILRGQPNARGLELARQLAMLTYRAELGLDARNSRRDLPVEKSGFPYRIQGYLEHQGVKLRKRFDARAYLLQLDVMDHHDVTRPPPALETHPIRASTLYVGIDSDQLFTAAQGHDYVSHLGRGGAQAERVIISSEHGHDGFLMEWDALAPLVTRALALTPAELRP